MNSLRGRPKGKLITGSGYIFTPKDDGAMSKTLHIDKEAVLPDSQVEIDRISPQKERA